MGNLWIIYVTKLMEHPYPNLLTLSSHGSHERSPLRLLGDVENPLVFPQVPKECLIFRWICKVSPCVIPLNPIKSIPCITIESHEIPIVDGQESPMNHH